LVIATPPMFGARRTELRPRRARSPFPPMLDCADVNFYATRVAMDETVAKYRRLDPQEIISTVKALNARIEGRFPNSGLGKISAELLRVANENVERVQWIQKPNFLLRTGAALLSVVLISVVIDLVTHIHQFQMNDYTNFIQALDASIGSVVFIGAAILFFVSWENRIKRGRALKAVHELRAMAHIVDMHQLTKDPENYFGRATRPVKSPKREMTPFELNRYFDYCNDSLALISKIAALYVQGFQDPVVLDAVDDVEDLTSGLARKIWQKIIILDNLTRSLPAETTLADAEEPETS
jgi:hypothetical protein